ncbi:hypothetical protein [Bradyrhizobium sp. LB11.1]|uniref:hypothetical protein n=1 Tax=Bradyrhizobium sp. LB11.1 TaxID=3156326 RepID=UPI0033947BF3
MIKAAERTCIECGAPFLKSERPVRTITCSEACGKERHLANKRKSLREWRRQRRERSPAAPGPASLAPLAPRQCDFCFQMFTPATGSHRARRCSPECRRAFARRYLQELRGRDPGWRERSRLDEAARRAARKAYREAREIELANRAAQPLAPEAAEYFRVYHGIRL